MAIGVQDTDVWAAADALLQAGEQPTIERVRLHLGRGSPNTVGPHLKAWFRGLGQRLDAQQASSTTPEPIARAAAQFWNAALDEARAQCAAETSGERAGLAQAQQDLQAARIALLQEQDRLRARETDLEEGMRAARAQAAAAEERLQATEAHLRESQRIADMLRGQVETARADERTLQQAMQQAQASHQAALDAAHERHTTHERRWLVDLDNQRQATKMAQGELDQLRQNTARDAALQAEALATAQKQFQQLEHDITQAQAEASRFTAELHTQNQAAAVLRAGLEQRNQDLETRIGDLREQLSVKDRQIEALMKAGAPTDFEPVEARRPR